MLATLLAEGSDAVRRRDYDTLRCLCGVAQATRRSGKSLFVTQRRAAHARLRDAVFYWSRVAVQRDPVCHSRYLGCAPAATIKGVPRGQPAPRTRFSGLSSASGDAILAWATTRWPAYWKHGSGRFRIAGWRGRAVSSGRGCLACRRFGRPRRRWRRPARSSGAGGQRQLGARRSTLGRSTLDARRSRCMHTACSAPYPSTR